MFDGSRAILRILIDGRVLKVLTLASLLRSRIRTAHYLVIKAYQIALCHRDKVE